MITAIVLIDTEAQVIPQAAQQIAEIDGISEVYSVTGEADLIAIARVAEHEQLADVIADAVSKVPGVLKTRTNIAFRTYSSIDLGQAFAIRLDD